MHQLGIRKVTCVTFFYWPATLAATVKFSGDFGDAVSVSGSGTESYATKVSNGRVVWVKTGW